MSAPIASNDDVTPPQPCESGHLLYAELWNEISRALQKRHKGEPLRFSQRDRIAKAAWVQYVHEIGQQHLLKTSVAKDGE